MADAGTHSSTYLLHGHRLLRRLVQLLDGLWVESQILLTANEDDRETGAEVEHFRYPL